jgi:hypothetical protein
VEVNEFVLVVVPVPVVSTYERVPLPQAAVEARRKPRIKSLEMNFTPRLIVVKSTIYNR